VLLSSIPDAEPRRSRRLLWPEAVFLAGGVLSAAPLLTIFYVLQNTVGRFLGISPIDTKYADNADLSVIVSVISLWFVMVVVVSAIYLFRLRDLPIWRWPVLLLVLLLPALLLQWFPWILWVF
jgi:hypothetical protein